MKTMSAMEVRKQFGAVIDEVRLKSETIILERAGKPVAKISPYSESEAISEDKVMESRLNALYNLAGLNADNPRTEDVDEWIKNERAGWDDRC